MAPRRSGRIYLGWRRHESTAGPVKLPARNYPAHAAARNWTTSRYCSELTFAYGSGQSATIAAEMRIAPDLEWPHFNSSSPYCRPRTCSRRDWRRAIASQPMETWTTTRAVGTKIDAMGTFETCRLAVAMSAYRGKFGSNRRRSKMTRLTRSGRRRSKLFALRRFLFQAPCCAQCFFISLNPKAMSWLCSLL
jgi:hypothetical protein